MTGVVEAADALLAALGAFDPELVTGEDCGAVVEALCRVENAVVAARVQVATRAASCAVHRKAGYRRPEEWLAMKAGVAVSRAASQLELARALRSLPATAAAFGSGELSVDQAGEIVRTEADAPGSEAEMLRVARRVPVGQLKEEGRRRRQGAIDVDELRRRQLKARGFGSWRDELGMVRLSVGLLPEHGERLVNRVAAEADRLRRAAKQSGAEVEPWERYAADAFVSILAGTSTGKGSRTDLVVAVDLSRWRGGEGDGHIVGGSPLPVELVKELSKDAFLKVVLHDGTIIHTVKHFGRHISAQLRTALDLGQPPGFDGPRCSRCGARGARFDWDHVDPLANGGETSLDNLDPKCWPCHRDKTDEDRQAGRLGRCRSRASPVSIGGRAPP